MQLLLISNTN